MVFADGHPDEARDEQRRACEDALVEWLEEHRGRYLEAARAAGLDGTVEAQRPVVVELTDAGSKIEGRVQNVNPLLLPGVAWTLDVELRDADVVPPVADLLYRTYGPRCEINTGFYPELFAELPAQWIAKVILRTLRWSYLSSLASLATAEPERARKLARQVLDLVEGENLVWLTMLPLAGLRVTERLTSGNVVLRPITPEEYLDLRSEEPFRLSEGVLRHARRFDFHHERAVLEVRESRSKRVQHQGDISRTRRVILALQLLGFDPAGRGQAVTVTEPFQLGGTRGSPISLAEHGAQRDVGQADLDASVELAERIPIGAVGAARTRDEIALARFQTAAVERSSSDAIVDQVIALEATFLHGVRDELRFRFALYGAWFLGMDRTDRLRLFDELKDLYDARSRIVHGTALLPHEIEALSALARRVSSVTLLRALRQGWPSAEALADAPLG